MSEGDTNISWSGWEVVQLIGRGSFGAVYEIQRKVFDDVESAALKVISIPQNRSDIDEMYSDGYDDETITKTIQSHLQSIVLEYSLMKKMNDCANIVNCDDFKYETKPDGVGYDVYIKMELLTPLTKALPEKITEDIVIKIAKDMCKALKICEKYGVVHRDIKPQNIFVSEHEDYKLGDFGIAKIVEKTMNGTKAGTSKYMAPEVYNNQPYGTSADIYSLGLVLYWLLNERRLPFMPLPPEKPKVGEEETCKQRRFSGEQLPEPFNGSKELKRIVLKACAYNSVDRYQDATEMLNDLKKLGDFAEEIPVIPTIPLVSNSFTKTEEKSVEVEAEVGKVVIKKEAKVEVVNEIADNISGESKHTIITKNFNLTNNKKLLIMCGMFSLVLVIIIVCCFFMKDTNNKSEDYTTEESNVLSVPDNAVSYNGHSYCIYSTDNLDWYSLQNFCYGINGYLATISSGDENLFIHNYISENYPNSNVYFGLSKNENNLWMWDNFEDFSYENWSDDNTSGCYAMFSPENIDGSWAVTDSIVSDINMGTAKIKSAVATSTLVESQITHSAERVFDDDITTAWVEGRTGYGIGDTLTINFDKNYLIDTIVINSGYQKTKELYNRNSRPSKLTVTFDDGTTEECLLEDVNDVQYITLNEPKLTGSVKLTIEAVYEGTVYKDTVISEIAFNRHKPDSYFICEWDSVN